MSLDPKVLVELEMKERGPETFISRGDLLVDLKFNSYGADLLSFNFKHKMSIFNDYVKEVMRLDYLEVVISRPRGRPEPLVEALKGLDKLIYEDTRLGDHLDCDVVQRLVMILREEHRFICEDIFTNLRNTSILGPTAYILSRAKVDTCDSLIKSMAIPTLMCSLEYCFRRTDVALPIVISLTRFACVSPDYVEVMLSHDALVNVFIFVRDEVVGTRLMDNLAKFVAVVCRAKAKILSKSQENLCLAISEKILSRGLGTDHMPRACYALQYLSYERPVRIQQVTIKILTQLSCNRDNTVAVSALGVLGNIARWGYSDDIEILAKDSDLLRCLQASLSDSKPMMFRWEVCQIIMKIADQRPTFAQRAKEVFRNHTRKLVGENISAVLRTLKLTTRTVQTRWPYAIGELNKILEFNALLIALKKYPDTSSFAQDLGSVSFLDGEYDGDRKMDDLELLYRTYVKDSLSSWRMEEDKLAALNQLRNIFGLDKREAESITLDVTSKVYRKRLDQSIITGRLEAAKNKADFLRNLCEELKFNAQKAVEIHEEIYRQKLNQSASNGELSDEDVKSLKRTQIMLCIPEETVDSAHADYKRQFL